MSHMVSQTMLPYNRAIDCYSKMRPFTLVIANIDNLHQCKFFLPAFLISGWGASIIAIRISIVIWSISALWVSKATMVSMIHFVDLCRCVFHMNLRPSWLFIEINKSFMEINTWHMRFHKWLIHLHTSSPTILVTLMVKSGTHFDH